MRLLALIMVLIATFTALASVTGDNSSGIAAELERLERKRFQAMIDNDIAALKELLSDDLVYTHSHGGVETKAQFIEALEKGAIKYVAIDVAEMAVRVYDNTAVINGRATLKVARSGQERSFGIRYLDVYTKRAQRWQMVAWQSTRLSD